MYVLGYLKNGVILQYSTQSKKAQNVCKSKQKKQQVKGNHTKIQYKTNVHEI